MIEPSYTIDQAVKDKAVVPLLYEGRLVLQQVDQKAIDKWFEVVTKPLSPAQRADLKKKFATADQLNKAERKIYEAAFDISEHYSQNWQGTGFKAQLAAPSKLAALKCKKFLDEFGKVTSEVVISAPDTREEQETVKEVDTEEVRAFWKKMMAKYGGEKEYNKQIINAFKHAPEPEILIVVSKLLTGFDAPRNTVLYVCRSLVYVCRSLVEHNLLQAIARVNRLYEGKDFGHIIDYYGVLQALGEGHVGIAVVTFCHRGEEIFQLGETDRLEIIRLPQSSSRRRPFAFLEFDPLRASVLNPFGHGMTPPAFATAHANGDLFSFRHPTLRGAIEQRPVELALLGFEK